MLNTEELQIFGMSAAYAVFDDAVDGTGERRRRAAAELYRTGEQMGLTGDLLRLYLTLQLIRDENPFSLALERRDALPDGTLWKTALADAALLRRAYVQAPLTYAGYKPMHAAQGAVGVAAQRIGALTDSLCKAKSDQAFLEALTSFYRTYGVGVFALQYAFYLDQENHLIPVRDFEQIRLSDLWGYEEQKKSIAENTAAFVAGGQANNVLLYGDSGTGKSSCIKALLNEFADAGLRMIQVHKHQLAGLQQVISVAKERNYAFVLYMDDLSFEDFETEYKYLKAVMEGGLAPSPSNMLVYATSNRRHLVRESWADRNTDDLHANDTKQEKLSLYSRFGLAVYFEKPGQEDYFEICRYLAHRRGLSVSDEELIRQARAFSVLRTGTSGRIAQQLVDMLAVKQNQQRGKD